MARRPQPAGSPARSVLTLVRGSVPPLHPAGRPFVLAGLLAAGMGLRFPVVRNLGLAWALASAAFFRQPRRVTPSDPGVAVAPADGQIVVIDEATPPAELGWAATPLPRISTFLSILDVHVQRAPVAGAVIRRAYREGEFLSADQPAASDRNERLGLVLQTTAGLEVGVVQVAGLVARRIVCDVEPGAELTAGEVYGLIRFGSRVDLYLPAGSVPQVLPGQRAVGGETVLARLP
jgi:phosphatidylserine decarboxylase